jgi:uncharacterized membrane protein
MRNFLETKSFGAAMVGIVTLGIGSLAEWSGWTLFSMPVVVMAVYWLIIIDGEAQ